MYIYNLVECHSSPFQRKLNGGHRSDPHPRGVDADTGPSNNFAEWRKTCRDRPAALRGRRAGA